MIVTASILALIAAAGDADPLAATTENPVVAFVGAELITLQDIYREWDLRRRLEDPSLAERPSPDEIEHLKREMVRQLLWIEHAKTFPRYVEIMTPKELDRITELDYASIWNDSLSEDDKNRLRRTAEARFAQGAVLRSDPDIQRISAVSPQELREFYHANPEQFRVPEQILMGQVALPKAVYGSAAASLAAEIRAAAMEGTSLREAAEALAPGSHGEDEWITPGTSDRLQEILDFLASASPGDVSAVIELPSSFQLVELRDRRQATTVPFEKAAPDIRRILSYQRLMGQSVHYFVFQVLPQAFFYPVDLFDPELKKLGYLRAER